MLTEPIPQSKIDEVISIVERNQQRCANLKQKVSLTASYESELARYVTTYLYDLSYDLRLILSALDGFRSTAYFLGNQLEDADRKIAELTFKLQNAQSEKLEIETLYYEATKKINELNSINFTNQAYIDELARKVKLNNSLSPLRKSDNYYFPCREEGTASRNKSGLSTTYEYNNTLSPRGNKTIPNMSGYKRLNFDYNTINRGDYNLNSYGRKLNYDYNTALYGKDAKSDSYRLNNSLGSDTKNSGYYGDYEGNVANQPNVKTNTIETKAYSYQTGTIPQNKTSNKYDFSTLQSEKPNVQKEGEQKTVEQKEDATNRSNAQVFNNNSNDYIGGSQSEGAHENNEDNQHQQKLSSLEGQDQKTEEGQSFHPAGNQQQLTFNQSPSGKNEKPQEPQEPEQKQIDLREEKEKINRIQKIVNDAFKDEKTINILKMRLGEDFETKLTQADVTEEYLNKIEEVLEDIREQEEDKECGEAQKMSKRVQIAEGNKKVKDPSSKDQLYNKVMLNKQITDKQYHYKEYPRGWTSTKDYFVNNGTSDGRVEKSIMKVQNVEK